MSYTGVDVAHKSGSMYIITFVVPLVIKGRLSNKLKLQGLECTPLLHCGRPSQVLESNTYLTSTYYKNNII